MDYTVNLHLPVNLPAGTPLPAVFPALAEALQLIAERAMKRWQAYANGATLPNGRALHLRSGSYARSIQMRQTGDMAYCVEATAPHAEAIESGAPARDMKLALNTSVKVRLTKAGKRYLIIPFRWGTPGTVGFRNVMPPEVHALASQFRASRVLGSAQVPNAIGVHDIATHRPVMITRRKYTWGDRLPAGLGQRMRPHHKTDPYAGMVRFDAPTGGHSRYLTFRTMVEGSSGWIRGAQPGYWIARTVTEEVERGARAVLEAALETDIRSMGIG